MNGSVGKKLSELDPATLNTTVVATFTNMQSIAIFPNYATIDEINNNFTFLFMNSSTGNRLYSVNLGNGSLVSNPLFPVGLTLTPPQQNVIELRYNNTTGALCGLHWGAIPSVTTALQEQAQKPEDIFNIFPNPFSNSACLSFSKNFKEGAIIISNSLGQVIRSISIYNSESIEIKKDGLSPGIYFVTVFSGSEKATKKILLN